MDTKKDIGKVFKDQFKDFEQTPGVDTWDKIVSGLDGGKKRPVAIFWLTGVGALLLVLIGISIFTTGNTPTVTTIENDSTYAVETATFPDNQNTSTTSENTLVTSSSEPERQVNTTVLTQTESSQNSENTIVQTQQAGIDKQQATGHNITRSQDDDAYTAQKETKTTIAYTAGHNPLHTSNLRTTVQRNNPSYTRKEDDKGIFNINQKATNAFDLRQKNEAILKAQYNNTIKQELEEAIAIQYKEAGEAYKQWITQQELEKVQALKKYKQDSLLAASQGITTAINAVEKVKKTRLPITAEERAIKREAAITYKWGVSPYISSINYGSLTKGSSIDNRQENNPREAISTTGYGIKLEFALSEKSSIRAGFGIAPLRYQTDNFQINISNNTVNIFELAGVSPEEVSQGATTTAPEALAFFNENNIASIIQDISYLEIPIDYQYRFINKRIGLSINPGVNILLLNDNSLSAIATNNSILEVGQETSLRDLSFALNLGISSYYNISKSWRFNIEPIFTYQLNPYTTTIGNFRPFYIGFQFGSSYKF